jgi:acetolactate synthase-1/3 small subunit
MKHTLVTLVEDKPGVLTRVAALFRRRGFNIESLTVGHSETAGISRMTIVVLGSDADVEQVIKQLYKLVNVVKVTDVTQEQVVIREMALIKVQTNSATRPEVIQFAEVFGGRIVDITRESTMIEITGTEDKVDALYNLLRPLGIKEMLRTGRVAMLRGGTNGNGRND